MSILKVNAVQGTDGVERYLARAWVNFNGTGTVAIRGSGNVSSITDQGVGVYTVNFATAMPDQNYAAVTTAGEQGLTSAYTTPSLVGASGFKFAVLQPGTTATGVDTPYVFCAFFR